MTQNLSGSVGLNGTNNRADTIVVQTLLTKRGIKLGIIDGRCGPRTISAIVIFQKSFLRHPDGLISPGGITWRRLSGAAAPAAATAPFARSAPLATATPAAAARTRNSSPYTVLLPVPDKATINKGLSSASNAVLLAKFGAPRENYSQDDLPITNESLKKMMVTASVGPFRVSGLQSAVDSLRLVMDDVRTSLPDLYSVLGSAGMKVCRYQRGSSSKISNHSWGTAIDLTVNGELDARGNNKVQTGLTLLAPFFNARGWYWGAGFGTEDGMHFECGSSLIATFPSISK